MAPSSGTSRRKPAVSSDYASKENKGGAFRGAFGGGDKQPD